MYISYNYLKELVKIPKDLSIKELASLLNLHTVEVEKIIDLKEQFNNIVVAEVLEVNKHPKADKLSLVKLDYGQTTEVVCGADNVAVGQKVALALLGAILPNGLEIKEVEIRGIKSKGMICAEDELGLGDDHEGILVLNKKAKKGQDLSKYLNLDDIIFEIDNKSLSHRGDLWGYYGIARDLSAILKTKLKDYQDFIDEIKVNDGKQIKVKADNKELCSRYMAWRLENIKVEESPIWLKNKIISAGYRPINNLVDASNLVMIELGQPLHVFCGDKLDNITVRLAKKGESLKTIDEKERALTEDDLVIADKDEILAIAGVMGGLSSAVNSDSQSIVIESANFSAISIRKTSQSLNLRTEASARFEKSLDPELAELAIKRLATIIKDICKEAKFIEKPVDIVNYEKNKINQLELSCSWIYKKIGIEIDKQEILDILDYLGFKVEENNDNLLITIPSWRAVKDVRIKEDILEEIARIYGYNKIKALLPTLKLKPAIINKELKLERKIKDFLSKNAAFSEDYNYAFVDEKQLIKMNIDTSSHWRLANPSSQNYNLLRQSLVPNLINSVIINQYRHKEISLFEIGRVFYSVDGLYNKEGGNDKLPLQDKKLSLIQAGIKNSFSQTKGVLEALLKNIFKREANLEFTVSEDEYSWSDGNYLVDIKIIEENIGYLTKIKSDVAEKIGLKVETIVAEINFSKLLQIYNQVSDIKYQEVPKFPAVERDLAFVVDRKLMYNDLYKAILNFSPLISRLELFDFYQGEKIDKNLKSLAFHISYQSLEKTLSKEEIDHLQSRLFKFLEDKYSAKLRDF
jgi:phenylalanyl-tRNA synthetase beta chain